MLGWKREGDLTETFSRIHKGILETQVSCKNSVRFKHLKEATFLYQLVLVGQLLFHPIRFKFQGKRFDSGLIDAI